MAVTASAVLAGTTTKVWDVTATADDTEAGTITHGLGAAPAVVTLTPLVSQGVSSVWRVAIGASTLVVTKSSVASSGLSGTAQIRVTAMLPHSLVG